MRFSRDSRCYVVVDRVRETDEPGADLPLLADPVNPHQRLAVRRWRPVALKHYDVGCGRESKARSRSTNISQEDTRLRIPLESVNRRDSISFPDRSINVTTTEAPPGKSSSHKLKSARMAEKDNNLIEPIV